MAAGSTYTPIATTTLGSAQASVTFSSISGSYTDLVLVGNLGSASAYFANIRFNSDTGSNYSVTDLYGTGSSAGSARASNRSVGDIDFDVNLPSDVSSNFIANIMNYSNSTTYKTTLTRMNNAANGVSASVVLWRNTNAITSITILSASSNGANTANIASGSTFTLYGIAAA